MFQNHGHLNWPHKTANNSPAASTDQQINVSSSTSAIGTPHRNWAVWFSQWILHPCEHNETVFQLMMMTMDDCPIRLCLCQQPPVEQQCSVTVEAMPVWVVADPAKLVDDQHLGSTPYHPSDLRPGHAACTADSWGGSCVSRRPLCPSDSLFPWGYSRCSEGTRCVHCCCHTLPSRHRTAQREMQIAVQLPQRTSRCRWWSSGSQRLRFQCLWLPSLRQSTVGWSRLPSQEQPEGILCRTCTTLELMLT